MGEDDICLWGRPAPVHGETGTVRDEGREPVRDEGGGCPGRNRAGRETGTGAGRANKEPLLSTTVSLLRLARPNAGFGERTPHRFKAEGFCTINDLVLRSRFSARQAARRSGQDGTGGYKCSLLYFRTISDDGSSKPVKGEYRCMWEISSWRMPRTGRASG